MQKKSLNYSCAQATWQVLERKWYFLQENKSAFDKSVLLIRTYGILPLPFLPHNKKPEPKPKKRCHAAKNDQGTPRIMVQRIGTYGLCNSPDSKASEDPTYEDLRTWRIGSRDFACIRMIWRCVSHYLIMLSSSWWRCSGRTALEKVSLDLRFSWLNWDSRDLTSVTGCCEAVMTDSDVARANCQRKGPRKGLGSRGAENLSHFRERLVV